MESGSCKLKEVKMATKACTESARRGVRKTIRKDLVAHDRSLAREQRRQSQCGEVGCEDKMEKWPQL